MRPRLAWLALAGAATPVGADAPRMPPKPITTSCAVGGSACVTINRIASTTTVTRDRRGPVLWRSRGAPPVATVSRDGRFLFEEYREGGLINLDDGADTLLLVVRDRGRVTRELRVRDIAARVADLPRTASHRSWSTVRYFDRQGRVILDLYDGRLLTIDPATGTIARQPAPADGRPPFCRYAEPDPHGPCAKR